MGVGFVDDWADAKDAYYKLTGQKKPRESFAKFFSTSHTGLSSSIHALSLGWEARPPKEQTPQAYAGLLEDFRKTKKKYIDTLDKLIKEESTKATKDPHDRTALKLTDLQKGLEMLASRLEKYHSSFELKLRKVNDEIAGQKDIEKSLSLETARGFAHFTAAAKAVAATPTVEVFEREFGRGKAVEKIVKALMTRTQAAKLSKEERELARQWIVKLAPWLGGEKSKLTQKQDVLPRLKEAISLVNNCGEAFNYH